MNKQDKPRGFSGDHHPPPPQPQPFPAPQYNTFQGISSYPPPLPDPHPAIGFPHTIPPPGATDPSAPMRERRLGCCRRLGCGWWLFIAGFFSIIPWYVGATFMLCSRVDHREKRGGYIACVIAAVVATIGIVIVKILNPRAGIIIFWGP